MRRSAEHGGQSLEASLGAGREHGVGAAARRAALAPAPALRAVTAVLITNNALITYHITYNKSRWCLS